MAVIRFALDKVMITEGSGSMDFNSDPQPMGGNDFCEVVWAISKMHLTGGGGTLNLVYKAQGSNDGTTWVDITGLTDSSTTAQTQEVGAFVRFAFIRFNYNLDLSAGGATDLGFCAFDLHANLMKSGS